MVYIYKGKPYKNGWFGVNTTIFGNIHWEFGTFGVKNCFSEWAREPLPYYHNSMIPSHASGYILLLVSLFEASFCWWNCYAASWILPSLKLTVRTWQFGQTPKNKTHLPGPQCFRCDLLLVSRMIVITFSETNITPENGWVGRYEIYKFRGFRPQIFPVQVLLVSFLEANSPQDFNKNAAQTSLAPHLRNLQGKVPERLEGKGACCTFPAAVVFFHPGATGGWFLTEDEMVVM